MHTPLSKEEDVAKKESNMVQHRHTEGGKSRRKNTPNTNPFTPGAIEYTKTHLDTATQKTAEAPRNLHHRHSKHTKKKKKRKHRSIFTIFRRTCRAIKKERQTPCTAPETGKTSEKTQRQEVRTPQPTLEHLGNRHSGRKAHHTTVAKYQIYTGEIIHTNVRKKGHKAKGLNHLNHN